MEHREIKRESESDRVAGSEISYRELLGLLVALKSLLLALIKTGSFGVFGNVSAIVSDHFQEESLGLRVVGRSEDVRLDDSDDVITVFKESSLDLGLVLVQGSSILLILLVLLNSRDGSDSRSLRRNEVFERNGEQIPLVIR